MLTRRLPVFKSIRRCISASKALGSAKSGGGLAELSASSTDDGPSEEAKRSIPIEKRSLTRGLALNRFEKDFVIYPEYTETDEVESIKKYIGKLKSDFESALMTINRDEWDVIPAQALNVLAKNNVFGTFISKEFGGCGFNQKDLLMVAETLAGDDLSLFMTFNQAQSAATLISIYGTAAQKEKYLPLIASFRCKPAICIHDEPTADGVVTEVQNVPGQTPKLNGVKIDVINGNVADVFIVFSRHKNADYTDSKCYIIDRQDLGVGGSITIQERVKTQGLKAIHFSKVNFHNVTIRDDQVLGNEGDTALDMLDEIHLNSKTFYGSASVGFLKNVINDLCLFANSRVEGNLRLADMHFCQSALSDLAIGVFVLESMVYYMGGLSDEELYLLNDVENSVVQRYSNRIMRQALASISDITGLAATNTSFPFDKVMRDALTLISTTDSDLKLVRNIALPTIETYISEHGDMATIMSKFTLSKLFSGDFIMQEKFLNPKLTHFIAEHVHPSLEPCARALEKSISRLNQVIDKLITDKGLYVKEDYIALRDLSTVMENHMGMVTTIARASRSYSIGLRGAESELAWTTYYCTMAARENENILKEILDFFGIMSFNPKLTEIGRDVLQNNGYCIENPIERNW